MSVCVVAWGRNHLYLEALRSGDYACMIFLVDDVSLIHVDWDTGLMAANPFREPASAP